MWKIWKKVLVLLGLTIVLGICSFIITGIVEERTSLRNTTVDEISSSRWPQQVIQWPILVIPYKIGTWDEISRYFYAPDKTQFNITTDTQVRSRAIYDALLFKASNKLIFEFDEKKLPTIQWDKKITWLINNAVILLKVSDSRGLWWYPMISINWLKSVQTNPQYQLNGTQWIAAWIDTFKKWDLKNPTILEQFKWEIMFDLKWSQELTLMPYGRTSSTVVNWNRAAPSFVWVLPDSKIITDSWFTSEWSWTSLTYNFAIDGDFNNQFWGSVPVYAQPVWGAYNDTSSARYVPGPIDNSSYSNWPTSSISIRFVQPYDAYQQNNRAIKYALLFIVMTFSIYFVIEILKKLQIHPVQYCMIWAALIIFYLLLLSLSEIIWFTTAYRIATVATVGLICLYTRIIVNHPLSTITVWWVLLLLYIYLFTLLRQAEYALLIWSIGLFAALGVIMYLTRQVNWYGIDENKTNS